MQRMRPRKWYESYMTVATWLILLTKDSSSSQEPQIASISDDVWDDQDWHFSFIRSMVNYLMLMDQPMTLRVSEGVPSAMSLFNASISHRGTGSFGWRVLLKTWSSRRDSSTSLLRFRQDTLWWRCHLGSHPFYHEERKAPLRPKGELFQRQMIFLNVGNQFWFCPSLILIDHYQGRWLVWWWC